MELREHTRKTVCTRSSVYGEWTVDSKMEKLKIEEVKGVR